MSLHSWVVGLERLSIQFARSLRSLYWLFWWGGFSDWEIAVGGGNQLVCSTCFVIPAVLRVEYTPVRGAETVAVIGHPSNSAAVADKTRILSLVLVTVI